MPELTLPGEVGDESGSSGGSFCPRKTRSGRSNEIVDTNGGFLKRFRAETFFLKNQRGILSKNVVAMFRYHRTVVADSASPSKIPRTDFWGGEVPYRNRESDNFIVAGPLTSSPGIKIYYGPSLFRFAISIRVDKSFRPFRAYGIGRALSRSFKLSVRAFHSTQSADIFASLIVHPKRPLANKIPWPNLPVTRIPK